MTTSRWKVGWEREDGTFKHFMSVLAETEDEAVREANRQLKRPGRFGHWRNWTDKGSQVKKIEEKPKVALWRIYLLGRLNEHKHLGFVYARADVLPPTVRHANLCADIVEDTSKVDDPWYRKEYPE